MYIGGNYFLENQDIGGSDFNIDQGISSDVIEKVYTNSTNLPLVDLGFAAKCSNIENYVI